MLIRKIQVDSNKHDIATKVFFGTTISSSATIEVIVNNLPPRYEPKDGDKLVVLFNNIYYAYNLSSLSINSGTAKQIYFTRRGVPGVRSFEVSNLFYPILSSGSCISFHFINDAWYAMNTVTQLPDYKIIYYSDTDMYATESSDAALNGKNYCGVGTLSKNGYFAGTINLNPASLLPKRATPLGLISWETGATNAYIYASWIVKEDNIYKMQIKLHNESQEAFPASSSGSVSFGVGWICEGF